MYAFIVATIAVVSIGLNGCGGPPPPLRYTHATANHQTYMQDRYVCIQQAQQGRSGAYVNQYGGASHSRVVTNRGVFLACMGAKGYNVDPNGPLTTPPELVVMFE
jgi:secreted trypsin-like serine protease